MNSKRHKKDVSLEMAEIQSAWRFIKQVTGLGTRDICPLQTLEREASLYHCSWSDHCPINRSAYARGTCWAPGTGRLGLLQLPN